MEISTWLYFLGLLNEKRICSWMNLILYPFYIAIDLFLEHESSFITDTLLTETKVFFVVTDTLLTLLFLAFCHCTVHENENEFVSIWNSWGVEMDNRPRAIPSFRRNLSRESKKSLKKSGKLILAYLVEIALEARCTKTCSTQKVQEPFAWGSCFTLVL